MKPIPTEDHWAIIRKASTYVPGDERSQINPGHGYPGYTVESIDYEAFTDRDALNSRLLQLKALDEEFTLIRAEPAKVEFKTSVLVGEY